MDVAIGLLILIIVFSTIVIKGEIQYRKDRKKKARMAAIRKASEEEGEKKLSARAKKRADKFVKIEGNVVEKPL
jgi:hypothetical protein